MACLDRFLHQSPASLRQWSQAAPRQIPQPFVSVARVNENDAFACGRLVKSGARMFRDKLKESFPLGSIERIEDLFAKLLEFFNADDSDRFGNRFAPFLIDGFDVDEFIE
jgi:hypothetical protein